jgi:dUTP pyrophosphatase
MKGAFPYLFDDKIQRYYDGITLPIRSTKGSAGYDIKSPMPLTINPGETAKFPTGIRCEMDSDYVLLSFARSSLGVKSGIVLSNGTGIIDSDYAYADNEGHIWYKLLNESDKVFQCEAGAKICQGIFVKYGITEDDEADGVRTGGIGSTGK